MTFALSIHALSRMVIIKITPMISAYTPKSFIFDAILIPSICINETKEIISKVKIDSVVFDTDKSSTYMKIVVNVLQIVGKPVINWISKIQPTKNPKCVLIMRAPHW